MPAERSSSNVLLLVLLGVFYFFLGFITWLNGTLIPYLRIACELSAFQASLVTFAFYISYFVMALPASMVLRRVGMKNGMALALFVMAIGALLFIPAANTRWYLLFLVGLFVTGTGMALLQTAINPYVTIIGPIESAAKRISIMGISNKFAGILAPMILGAVVLHDADELTERLKTMTEAERMGQLDELAHRVIGPYGLFAGVLALLGALVRWSPLPEVKAEGEGDGAHGWREAMKHPHLVLGVIALFLYVGVEVLAGDSIAVYAQRAGTPLSVAKLLTSATLTAMLVGYVIGIITIPKVLSQGRALQLSALVGTVFTVCVAAIDPANRMTLPIFDFATFKLVHADLPVSVVFVALLGLANALVWPAIWPLAIDGLGPATKTGSALLIMAILGGALVMPIWTLLAGPEAAAPAQNAYWLCLPCYLFIGWYAIKGCRLRRWG